VPARPEQRSRAGQLPHGPLLERHLYHPPFPRVSLTLLPSLPLLPFSPRHPPHPPSL
jgi:hypothetical protein